MAEIKSTLDLVLEKTKHLTLSEEEKQIQRHDEFRKTLKGLIRKFADKALKMKELKKELEILQETYEVKNPHPKGAALKNPPIGGTRPCPQRGRAV